MRARKHQKNNGQAPHDDGRRDDLPRVDNAEHTEEGDRE